MAACLQEFIDGDECDDGYITTDIIYTCQPVPKDTVLSASLADPEHHCKYIILVATSRADACACLGEYTRGVVASQRLAVPPLAAHQPTAADLRRPHSPPNLPTLAPCISPAHTCLQEQKTSTRGSASRWMLQRQRCGRIIKKKRT